MTHRKKRYSRSSSFKDTTLDDFLRVSPEETVKNIAEHIVNIRSEIDALYLEKKGLEDLLKRYITENEEELKIITRKNGKFLRIGNISISLWDNFTIPNEKLENILKLLRKNNLDAIVSYKIDKTKLERTLRTHTSTPFNSNNKLNEIIKYAINKAYIITKRVVVVKKKPKKLQ